MAIRIKYTGKEPDAPPGSDYWQPREERDIDDKDWAARLLQNPDYQRVPKVGDPDPGVASPSPEQPATTIAPEGSH